MKIFQKNIFFCLLSKSLAITSFGNTHNAQNGFSQSQHAPYIRLQSDFLQHAFDTSRVTHASVIEPVVRLEPLPNIRKFAPTVRLPDKGEQSSRHKINHGRLSPVESTHDDFAYSEANAVT